MNNDDVVVAIVAVAASDATPLGKCVIPGADRSLSEVLATPAAPELSSADTPAKCLRRNTHQPPTTHNTAKMTKRTPLLLRDNDSY
jgi:hypothetical protein